MLANQQFNCLLPNQARIIYKFLKLQEYQVILHAMQDFTHNRQKHTIDEIWFLEHPKVLTLGKNSLPENILDQGTLKVIKADRGGQVTYHGPGQLIVYVLLDLVRRSLTVKKLIYLLQQSIIDFLEIYYNIKAKILDGAPGVYVGCKKICSIGLKITRGYSYHGLSFNVNMDLMPFKQINPCGDPNLEITQLKDLINDNNISVDLVAKLLKELLHNRLINYGI